MNRTTITQRQAEQAAIESSEEYQYEQRLRYFDELLDRLHETFARIHKDDAEFARYLRKSNRTVALCEQCRKEV